MKTSLRPATAIGVGFFVGLIIGPISVFAFFATHVLRKGEEWPELTGKLLINSLVASLPSAINGAIGTIRTIQTRKMNRLPVTVFPLILHVFIGVFTLAMEPQSFLFGQLYALSFTAIMWAAGRIGQRVAMLTPDTTTQS